MTKKVPKVDTKGTKEKGSFLEKLKSKCKRCSPASIQVYYRNVKRLHKLISDEGNTGVEVRSHPVKGKASRLHGYHADIGHIGIGDKVLGAWDFHENNRGDYLAKRGNKVTINESGKKEIEEIADAFEPSDANADDWNKVVVYAKGNRLWFTINGKIASEVIDNEKAKRLDKGYIGFQLHGGDKMIVAFKDISVKR